MKGPPYRCDSGDVVNIDRVARVGVFTVGIDGTVKDVGSSMVIQPNVYPIGSTRTLIDTRSRKAEETD